MSTNAGKGLSIHLPAVHVITKKITFADDDVEVSMGWVAGNCAVVGSGVVTKTAFNGNGEDAVDIGFRNSVQGEADDPNAFTEIALDLDAVGHVAGDVVSTANKFFTAPAEITCTPSSAGTAPSAGEAYVYVQIVNFDNSEDL